MTVTLTKTKAARWMGNGMGNEPAEYIVAQHPHISVVYFAGRWNATDTNTGQRIAKADKLTDLRAKLINKE